MKDALLEEIDEPSLGLGGFDVQAVLTPQRLRELTLQHFDMRYGLTFNRFDERPHDADWNDGNRYLYLWDGDRPSAFAGWLYADQFFPGKKCVWITSLQGVFHVTEPKPVPPQSWARSFIRCMEDIYANSGLHAICITPAEENTWYDFGQNKIVKQKKMREVYNETATSLGYTRIPVTMTHNRPALDDIALPPLFLKSVYCKPLPAGTAGGKL